VSAIAVTPAELAGAAAGLQRAGGDLSTVGGRALRGTGAGDLGAPELERAVVELSEASLQVVIALFNAVERTGANLAASAAAYETADGRSMRGGR
jgi:hypothetical protein